MKSLLVSTTLAALVVGSLPAAASEFGAGARVAGFTAIFGADAEGDAYDRRGRGRGRGGDRDRDDHRGGRDDDRRGGGGHGGRPRVPGGSGCDDPHDLVEHPECRV